MNFFIYCQEAFVGPLLTIHGLASLLPKDKLTNNPSNQNLNSSCPMWLIKVSRIQERKQRTTSCLSAFVLDIVFWRYGWEKHSFSLCALCFFLCVLCGSKIWDVGSF